MNAILPRPAYEDSLMQITFSDDKPTFDGANLMVRFMARVEDHFGAGSPLESELMEAFDKGRNRIRSVCAEALDQNDGEGVVLHSGLFRVEGMEPDRGTAV
jgi:hypothetical protein